MKKLIILSLSLFTLVTFAKEKEKAISKLELKKNNGSVFFRRIFRWSDKPF